MRTYKNIMNKLQSKSIVVDSFYTSLGAVKKKKIKPEHLKMNEREIFMKYSKMIENYHQPQHVPKVIIDGSKKKRRTVVSPSLDEIVAQRILCKPIEAHVKRCIHENIYGSIPGRGQHDVKRKVERWVQKGSKNTRYCLRIDIRKFFDSIDTKILKRLIKRKFKDNAYKRSLFNIIDFQERGLPLGFYTSHWLAHFYLLDFDEFILQDVKPKYYIRYVDDILIFHHKKKRLHEIRARIVKYLENKLGLKIKKNYQVFEVSYLDIDGKEKGRAIDFIGYKFHYNRTTMRKSILKKLRGKSNKIYRDGLNVYVARQLASYLGWISHSDTFDYYVRYVQKTASMKMVRNYISKYDKKQSKKRREAKKKAKKCM